MSNPPTIRIGGLLKLQQPTHLRCAELRGSLRMSSFRSDADAVQAGPRPVQPAVLAELVQNGLMQPVEDAGLVPLAHPPPAGPARAVAELAGQLGPADAGGQHEGDALEHVAVRRPGPPGAAVHRRRPGRISGSTSAHSSSLISRDGGEDTDDDMPPQPPPTLTRSRTDTPIRTRRHLQRLLRRHLITGAG